MSVHSSVTAKVLWVSVNSCRNMAYNRSKGDTLLCPAELKYMEIVLYVAKISSHVLWTYSKRKCCKHFSNRNVCHVLKCLGKIFSVSKVYKLQFYQNIICIKSNLHLSVGRVKIRAVSYRYWWFNTYYYALLKVLFASRASLQYCKRSLFGLDEHNSLSWATHILLNISLILLKYNFFIYSYQRK